MANYSCFRLVLHTPYDQNAPCRSLKSIEPSPLCGICLTHGISRQKKLESGEITKEEYDQWRYTYPIMEAEQTRQELDALREKRKAENNTDKKSQQKRSCQIDFTQFSKTFSIGFS